MKYFTSDLHLGHPLLANLRGYTDLAEHDQTILDTINAHVGRNDELYILGDFSWPKPQKYRPRITSRHIIYIIGNHDKPLAIRQTFGDHHKIHITKVCGHQTILSHYPIAYWHNSHHGSYHLYGHVHAKRETILDTLFPGRRAMDVGIDYSYQLHGDHRPFSEEEIHALLSTRPGHDNLEAHGMTPYDSKNPNQPQEKQ